nr:MAG TPA: hypothetical protein [Caudoviricetes sp.]
MMASETKIQFQKVRGAGIHKKIVGAAETA